MTRIEVLYLFCKRYLLHVHFETNALLLCFALHGSPSWLEFSEPCLGLFRRGGTGQCVLVQFVNYVWTQNSSYITEN